MNFIKASRFLLFLTPFVATIVVLSVLFPFITGKFVLFRSLVGFSFIFLLLEILFGSQSNTYWRRLMSTIKSPLGIAIAIFTVAFLLAVIFSFDPAQSFWSNFERGEGGLQIIFLYMLFLLFGSLFKSEKDWKKYFWITLAAALLVVLYGVGAGLKYVDADTQVQTLNGVEQVFFTGTGGPLYNFFHGFVGPSFGDASFRLQGSFGNAAYLAAYMIFALFYVSYLWFSDKNKSTKKQFWLGVFALVFGLSFFLAATRGAFLGLGLGVALALLYLALSNKSWRKPIASILLALIILGGIGFVFRDNPTVKSIPASRIFDLSLSTETLQHRIIMWGIAWEGWKAQPVFGWGPENYNEIFYRHYNPDYYNPASSNYGAWFDRAHNIFFDYLAEIGAVGLLSYIAIFIVLASLIWKSSDKNRMSSVVVSLFIALPVAYLVQGMALFEVLTVYMSLYTFLAFANYKFSLNSHLIYHKSNQAS